MRGELEFYLEDSDRENLKYDREHLEAILATLETIRDERNAKVTP